LRAGVIVTANLRDFPASTLSTYGIEAQHPDAFILGLFNADPDVVFAALRELRASLKKPALTAAELLASMAHQGLTATADALGGFIDAL